MPGRAYDTMAEFWALQDTGKYRELLPLFAEDGVLVDPIYGDITGREDLGEFLAKMEIEMARIGVKFRLEALAGDDTVAWSRWMAHTSRGERFGCGIYQVRDGKITYYRDYMNAKRWDGQR